RCEYARHGERGVCVIVEERVWPTEPAQPPAEKLCPAAGDDAELERGRRIRWGRPHGGTLVDPTEGSAKHLISGSAIGIDADERMNDANNREARAGGVADRRPATVGVPAEDLAGEVQTAHGVRARGKVHATRWHLEDVCSARSIEHVRALEETRERLAVLAVA